MKTERSWTTQDEMEAIKYMASDEKRANEIRPTKKEKLFRLNTWLKTADTRRWPARVNVNMCRQVVKDLISELA